MVPTARTTRRCAGASHNKAMQTRIFLSHAKRPPRLARLSRFSGTGRARGTSGPPNNALKLSARWSLPDPLGRAAA